MKRPLQLNELFHRFPIAEVANPYGRLVAILGFGQPGLSFKDLLGQGMLIRKRELGELAPGQPVLIDTSSNAGFGVALAGRQQGHPVHVVTCKNIPPPNLRRLRGLGAQVWVAPKPHPTGGWQESRRLLAKQLVDEHPDWVLLDQNNDSRINVGAHERFLIPQLEEWIDPRDFDAAVFVVGSGGHFAAISKWLKRRNPRISTFAADREGSITFGGIARSSFLRGVGNMGLVPRVIQEHMNLVDGVLWFCESDAIESCATLSRLGLFCGGSSGIAYAAATHLLEGGRFRSVLTLFADRGDPYFGSPLYPDLEDKS